MDFLTLLSNEYLVWSPSLSLFFLFLPNFLGSLFVLDSFEIFIFVVATTLKFFFWLFSSFILDNLLLFCLIKSILFSSINLSGSSIWLFWSSLLKNLSNWVSLKSLPWGPFSSSPNLYKPSIKVSTSFVDKSFWDISIKSNFSFLASLLLLSSVSLGQTSS